MINNIKGSFLNLTYKGKLISEYEDEFVTKEINRVILLAKKSEEHKEVIKSYLISEQNYKESLDYLFTLSSKIRRTELVKYIVKASAESRKIADNYFFDKTGVKPIDNPNINDLSRAQSIADNYEQAYKDKYNSLLDDGLSRADARDEAASSFEYKKDQIAITESNYAYNSQLNFQMSQIEQSKAFRKAYLDFRTCPVCRKLHNTKVVNIDDFWTHANCRCLIVYNNVQTK